MLTFNASTIPKENVVKKENSQPSKGGGLQLYLDLLLEKARNRRKE